MNLYTLACALVLSLISTGLALQCYQCDGVKGKDLPCAGDGQLGTKVECQENCGLLKMEILHFDRTHSSVVSTDTRWRRGCTSDGSEITQDSEMAGQSLPAPGLGCKKIGDRSEDNKKIIHTLCVCNSTLCNERNSGWSLSVPVSVKIILTLTLTLLLTNN